MIFGFFVQSQLTSSITGGIILLPTGKLMQHYPPNGPITGMATAPWHH